jgi:hypothetical protein
MPGKRHIPGGSSAASSREEGRESSARNTKFAEKPGCSDFRCQKSNAATGTDRFRGPDCSTCGRFELPERERFVGPEAVAEFLDIDPETAVRFARLGYIPAHPLHVIGKRMTWRFLLSEVHAAMLSRTNAYYANRQDQRELG